MTQQNESLTHDEIAAIAQKIWEDEGEPEGKAEEHWQRAEEQLKAAQGEFAQAEA